VVLTEKGILLDREIFSHIEENEARLTSGFSEGEKQKIIELLNRVLQNINE
jgi:DNA-binding MarR family transcriptional regulator